MDFKGGSVMTYMYVLGGAKGFIKSWALLLAQLVTYP